MAWLSLENGLRGEVRGSARWEEGPYRSHREAPPAGVEALDAKDWELWATAGKAISHCWQGRLGIGGGSLGGRVNEVPRAAQEETPLVVSPSLCQGTCLCFQGQALATSLEEDPVVSPGRIPKVEASGDDRNRRELWQGQGCRREAISSPSADRRGTVCSGHGSPVALSSDQ